MTPFPTEIAEIAEARDLLAVTASDLLGAGFGTGLLVERFADSLGLDRPGLDRELRRFGEAAGYSLCWLQAQPATNINEATPSL